MNYFTTRRDGEHKQHELTIDIGANRRRNIITDTNFFTMDSGTARKVIRFTLDGEPFDLTDKHVLVGFEFVDANVRKVFETSDLGSPIVIEHTRLGRINVNLPNDVIQYSGEVLIHVYILFPDGRTLDAGVIVTEFRESWLDGELEEMSDFYVSRFENLARELEERVGESQRRVEELQDELSRVTENIADNDFIITSEFDGHINAIDNPHQVTIEQIPQLQEQLNGLQGHIDQTNDQLNQHALVEHTHTIAQIAGLSGHIENESLHTQLIEPRHADIAAHTYPLGKSVFHLQSTDMMTGWPVISGIVETQNMGDGHTLQTITTLDVPVPEKFERSSMGGPFGIGSGWGSWRATGMSSLFQGLSGRTTIGNIGIEWGRLEVPATRIIVNQVVLESASFETNFISTPFAIGHVRTAQLGLTHANVLATGARSFDVRVRRADQSGALIDWVAIGRII